MTSRVGQGFDAHAFEGDGGTGPLVLGGVSIPGGPGLTGHSDADVVLHALADALLGAAGQGDLGDLVGIDEPGTAGASSHVFVEEALRQAREAGWSVANADLTVVAQEPHLGPHRQSMRARVAELLEVAPAAVNVKATTTDHLGALGRREGIACLAVVLLEASPSN